MTYKNIKFENSEIMRSLEKLALEKGLAKPQKIEIKKEAKAEDLSPTNDFSENLLKLCRALTKQGLTKYAQELESKFLTFNQADKLYAVAKEKSLLETAHPAGSVQLKGVAGDAVIETLSDAKQEIEAIIKKTPKTRLANKDLINMVKIVLAAPEIAVVPDLIMPAAKQVGQQAAKQVATKAPGFVARFLPTVSEAVSGVGTAGELGAAEVGAAGGASALAIPAAIIAGAVAGGLAGNKLFKSFFEQEELIPAGKQFIAEVEDIKNQSGFLSTTYESFKNSFNLATQGYKKFEELQQNPNLESLNSLDNCYKEILKSSDAAYKIVSWATNKGGDGIVSRLGNLYSGIRDVELAGSNYISVANNTALQLHNFLNTVKSNLQQRPVASTNANSSVAYDPTKDPVNIEIQRLNDLIVTYNGYLSVGDLDEEDLKKGHGQLQALSNEITKIVSFYDPFKDKTGTQKQNATQLALQKLKEIDSYLAQFKKVWFE